MENGWKILIVAGIMEVVWAIAMDYSDGFTVWYFDVIVVIFLTISTVLLAKALKSGIPIGTAYAVWTGIGAVGTLLISYLLGNEAPAPLRFIFVAMIIGGIIGLQLTSKSGS